MLALVTCADALGLDTDLPLLTAHLDADVVVWDDPRVEWGDYDAVIVRSAWDYPRRRDEFIGWATAVDAVTDLWNPLDLIAWNTDKRYLGEIAAMGLPVVPSWFVVEGESLPSDLDLTADLVVKPTVGGGSRGVMRTSDPDAARAHITALHDDGLVALVQPYRASIDDDGETGLVYVGGDFSHSFEKSAILAAPVEWEGTLYVKESIRARVASAAQRALADTVVASLPPTAYARIDLVPGEHGAEILEVELTEPSLFLHTDPDAPARAAAAFRNLTS